LHWEQEPMDYLTGIIGDRAYKLIPLKSMLDYGLTVAGGSDAPCTLPDPIHGMYAACNHPNPDQRISILDALRMYTNWGARLSFDDENRGTLSEGKCADFVVLDKNPLFLEPEKLKEINVTGIHLHGKPYIGSIKKPFDLCVKALKNVLLS
jgi:predicted amidohydrolase YtcJ